MERARPTPVPLERRWRRPGGMGTALALLLALASAGPPSEVRADEGRVAVGALALGALDDPDLLPPDLVVPLERLGELVEEAGLPPPRSLVVRRTGVALDWDGDGRVEVSARAGRPTLVRAPRAAGPPIPLLLYDRGGAWWIAPAGLLSGTVDGLGLAVLDADLDGRFDGAADRWRTDDGAFFRPSAERRVPREAGLARLELRLADGGWTARLTPEAWPAAAPPAARRGLLGVNTFRNRVGLAPLALDLAWCAGCQRHAEYIRLNPADGFGHAETPGRPGWSPEGHEAAVEGVMERTGDPARAVERLTAMLLHRTPFLCDPAFGVGVGAVGPLPQGATAEGPGAPGYSVLRAGAALRSSAYPVLCPGPGQRDVPLTLLEEAPTPEPRRELYGSPRGYPVTVSFLAASQAPGRLELRVAGRREALPAYVFSRLAPVHPAFAHAYATVFLATEEPLPPKTTLEATYLPAEPSARALLWRFTTGTRGP